MRRRLLIIAAFLVAGAVVNVAVAWGCAVCMPVKPWTVVALRGQEGVNPVPRGVLTIHEQHLSPGNLRNHAFGVGGVGYDGYNVQADTNPSQFISTRAAFAGWPAKTFWGYDGLASEAIQRWPQQHRVIESWASGLRVRRVDRWIPYLPLWPGFTVNTAFYAVVLYLLIPGPFVLRRFIRRRCGLCPKCAYPVGESVVCTECGRDLAT